jgi:predicted kinase
LAESRRRWAVWAAPRGRCEYHRVRSVLVVIGGLPATGKSTIATALASRTATPYVRVDRIEQAIVAWSPLSHPLGPVGYAVAYELALEQLQLGLDVIVECVNPVAVTRDGWVGTAAAASAGLIEAEVICSDEAEHRHRVETRTSDVDGLVKPTWSAVVRREYEPWTREHTVIDTTTTRPESAVDMIAAEMAVARSAATSRTAPA